MASKAALEIILRARDEASKTVQGTSKAFGVLQGAVAGLVAGGMNIAANAAVGLAKGAAQAGRALFDMVVESAPIEGIGAAFRGLNSDATATMKALRQGALHMITDAELMRQYNQATQMVSKSFADDLPNAMGYLSKVSASTGRDMDYLLDSLTTGIGRLSPMILDNLNIQVDQVAAYEAYAQTIGKSVDELNKQEQQAALTAQVMDRLAQNTADLPDITQNATTKMAQLRTTFQNVKDQVLTALLPVLIDLLTPLGELATEYGPQVADWLIMLVPLLESGAQAFGSLMGFVGQVVGVLQDFIWMLSIGIEPLDALRMALAAAFGPEVAEKITSFVTGAQSGMETLSGVFGEVWGFILDLVGQAVAWFQENLPLIQQTGQTLADFFQNHVAPAMDNAWTIIKTLVSTALTLITGVITTTMQIINGDWSGAWETIKETAATIWEGIKTVVTEFMEGVLNAIGSNLDEFKATWSSNWEMAKTIVSTIWANIVSAVTEKMAEVRSSIESKLNEVKSFISGFSLRDVGASLIEGLKGGVLSKAQSIADAAASVVRNAINAAKRALGISSPSKVGHEIMTNFVGTMADTARQMREVPAKAVNDMMMQSVRAAGVTPSGHNYVLGRQVLGMPAMAGAGGAVNVVIHNHFGSDSVRSEADIETITRRQQEMLLLRGVRTFEV
jgi:phage-related protein